MTTVTLRFDEQTKSALDDMVSEMGMNLTTFFMVYVKRTLRERRIPFEIEASNDLFYSHENIAQLERSERQLEEGRIVVKTIDELEAMENE